MATVTTISPELRRIDVPDELKLLPGWLCWRAEQAEGAPKALKVPYYASGRKRSGEQGTPTDRAKLVSFAAVLNAAQRLGMTGIGFAPLPEFGITILDFDKCVGPDGELPPEIESITARTFSEYSPSGTGVHSVLRGNLGDTRARALNGNFGLDVFSEKGFVTFTGAALPHIDILGLENRIAPVQQSDRDFVAKYGAQRTDPKISDDFTAGYEPILNLTSDEVQSALDALDPDMGRDDWLRVGFGLSHQFGGNEDGFQLWDEWSSAGSTYPGEEGLRAQWDSFTRRMGPGRPQVTMASVLKMAREAAGKPATAAEIAAHVESLPVAPAAAVQPSTGPGYEGKFAVTHAAGMAAQKPVEWLIKGVLPKADLGVIFGQSGAGKSFVALDMAMAIGRGVEWRGHKVKQGRVIVIVAEGAGSYGKRFKAYCQHYEVDINSVPIGAITEAPNLLEVKDVTELAAAVSAAGGCDVLIIDTLAQVTPGSNENSSEDMGRAITHAQVLGKATGAMVVLIHHAGKDEARGARGWSGLKGALDVEIEVSRDEGSDVREIRLSKMKDEEDGLRFGFKLETVTVGMDEDGDELRSCIIVEGDVRQRDKGNARGGVVENDEFETAVLEVGRTLADGTLVEHVIQAVVDVMPGPEEGEMDRRRQYARRAIDALARRKRGGVEKMGNRLHFY